MDIEQILADHVKWLNGDYSGKQADFSGANLSRADFTGTNLFRADLRRANLEGLDFSGVNFFATYLSGASLLGAYWDDGIERSYMDRWTKFTNRRR